MSVKNVFYKKGNLWNDGVSVVDYRDDAFDGLLAFHHLQPCLRVPAQKAFTRQRKIELYSKLRIEANLYFSHFPYLCATTVLPKKKNVDVCQQIF
jgi:hypothetical protein